MKAFCITLSKMPKSVELAARCVQSGEQFGIEIEIFDAIDRYHSGQTMIDEGLRWDRAESLVVSDKRAVIGCFMSHYLIWQKCADLHSEVLILEHDAVITQPIPTLDYIGAIHIAKLGWGEESDFTYQNTHSGICPLYTDEFKGTFGYLVKPNAAKTFIQAAQKTGIRPVDKFLNIRSFPFLQQLNPGLIVHKNNFSSIQKYPRGGVQITQEQVWREYVS